MGVVGSTGGELSVHKGREPIPNGANFVGKPLAGGNEHLVHLLEDGRLRVAAETAGLSAVVGAGDFGLVADEPWAFQSAGNSARKYKPLLPPSLIRTSARRWKSR